MKTKEKSKIQLDILKDELHRMLDDSNGIITDEIVKISQALDEIIIQETERYNYAKKNNTTHEWEVLGLNLISFSTINFTRFLDSIFS